MKKLIILTVVALTSHAGAAVPDRNWPSVVPEPVLDIPMRDTAITRGPNGMYYLTGTLGVPCSASSSEGRPGEVAASCSVHPESCTGIDFDNSRQIKLWKSQDLKQWQEIGVVYDLTKDAPNDDRMGWARLFRVPLEPEAQPYVWGFQAPELHYIKGDWYIAFSINGQGTGLLKSQSGKPEGPYKCHARITTHGGDASMFVDETPSASEGSEAAGGTVYWITDGGYIAPLTDDLKMLARRPELIVPAPDPVYETRNGTKVPRKDAMMSDHPKKVGERGAFLFKVRDRYYLTAADYNSRLGVPCDDTFIAYADSLDGPWSERHLMIPNGGGITVFEGPASSAVPVYNGPWDIPDKKVLRVEQIYATFSGTDVVSIFRNRPSFIPLEWISAKRWDVYFFKDALSFPRKPQHVFTERGPWKNMRPMNVPAEVRDMAITLLPDGKYYYSGSILSRPGELLMYRSDDLIHWEETPVLFRYRDIPWLADTKKLDAISRFGKTFWGVRPYFWEGDYYLEYWIFNDAKVAPDNRGGGLLKSTTGRIEGPYEALGRTGGQLGLDPDLPPGMFFEGLDGRLYANKTINWHNNVAVADLSTPPKEWDFKPVDQGGAIYATDAFGQMTRILDHYVYIAVRWGGPVANVAGAYSEAAKHYGTYDHHYQVCKTPWGPVDGPLRPISRVGAGNLFQDKKGYWWHTYFGNEHSGPFWQAPGIVPMNVQDLGDDLLIEVDNTLDPYQLEVTGGGEIADVETVLETLE